MGPAVIGTLLITGAAALMAIPIGILGGIYLNEYGGRGILARVIRFLVRGDDRRAVGGDGPLRLHVRRAAHAGAERVRGRARARVPDAAHRDPHDRRDAPPGAQRSCARGATRSGSRKARTIRTVVFPNAMPGIVSGSLLAVARAAGETAPLLFTIGIVTETNTSLFNGPNTTLSYQIFRNASSPFPGAQDRAWGAALTLIAIVFIFTVLARLATTFFARRQAA